MLALQGWEIAVIGAAVVPYLPAIASGITGSATILAAHHTWRKTRDQSKSNEEQETIDKIRDCLFDAKRNFNIWIDPATQHGGGKADQGSQVDQALTDVDRIWNAKSELFTRTETPETFNWIVSQFRRHHREVSAVMLVGKQRSPNYEEVLGEARDWLNLYETDLKDKLNDCFFRERASMLARVRKSVSENPLSEWQDAKKRRKIRERLEARRQQVILQPKGSDTTLNQRELEGK
jgi:hypothetical protein